MNEQQNEAEWSVADWHGKLLELSQADESALYHHYELNYTPPPTESGRRLARR